MLFVSSDVLATFSSESEDAFFVKLADFLQQNVAGLAYEPRSSLLMQVRQLSGQSLAYGLTTEIQVSVYVLTAAYLGVDFCDSFAGVKEILESPAHGDEKAFLLQNFTTALFETLGA